MAEQDGTPQDTTKKPAQKRGDGRSTNGRFVKGNKAAVGRSGAKTRRREAAKIFCESMTKPEIKAIVRKLMDLAQAGDVEAARLVLSYSIGRPREMDAEPIQIDLPMVQSADDLPKAFAAVFTAVRAGEVSADELRQITAILTSARDAFGMPAMRRELDELRTIVEARDEAAP